MILVTGGTGLVGSHLLFKLASQNEKIRAIYRSKTRLSKVKRVFSYYSDNHDDLFNKIDWIQADITNIPELDKVFKDVNIVYHCAAYISFNKKEYRLARAINVKGTANIVNLCLSHNVSKLCHVSSIATLGEQPNGLITEETHWNPENNKHNIYSITKYGAELEVWRGTQEGLNAVIVNPGVIIGPGFWKSGTGQLFTNVKKGLNYYTTGTVGIIDVRDVAEAMVNLTKSETKNERYILISENISYESLIGKISAEFGNKKNLKEANKQLLYCYLVIDYFLSFFNGKGRSIFKSNIISVYKNLKYDNSKIHNLLKQSFITTDQSIKDIVNLFNR